MYLAEIHGIGLGTLSMVILVLDIVAIVSVLGAARSLSSKLLWILAILLLPVIGMILYFILGRAGERA